MVYSIWTFGVVATGSVYGGPRRQASNCHFSTQLVLQKHQIWRLFSGEDSSVRAPQIGLQLCARATKSPNVLALMLAAEGGVREAALACSSSASACMWGAACKAGVKSKYCIHELIK